MISPELPSILHPVLPLLNNYGYIAVGGLLLLQNIGVPFLPAWLVMIAAAVYASAGQLSIVWLAVVAIMAAITGSSIGFALGRYAGDRTLEKYGKYIYVTPERLKEFHRFYKNNGFVLVLFARFIPPLRLLNGFIAGSAEMRWHTFSISNSIGATLWIGVWLAVFYNAGSHLTSIYNGLLRYQLVFFGVLIGILVIIAHLKTRNEKPGP